MAAVALRGKKLAMIAPVAAAALDSPAANMVALRGKKLAMIAPVAAAALDSPAANMEAKVSREERRREVMLYVGTPEVLRRGEPVRTTSTNSKNVRLSSSVYLGALTSGSQHSADEKGLETGEGGGGTKDASSDG